MILSFNARWTTPYYILYIAYQVLAVVQQQMIEVYFSVMSASSLYEKVELKHVYNLYSDTVPTPVQRIAFVTENPWKLVNKDLLVWICLFHHWFQNRSAHSTQQWKWLSLCVANCASEVIKVKSPCHIASIALVFDPQHLEIYNCMYMVLYLNVGWSNDTYMYTRQYISIHRSSCTNHHFCGIACTLELPC